MITLSGLFWRVRFKADAATLLDPAHSPEGRFHHDGQDALYLSDSSEGAVIATRTYEAPGDGVRGIYPIRVENLKIIDLRDPDATQRHGIDITQRAARWQEIVAKGNPSPTWPISDRARASGAEGMIYASRKQPDRSHLVVFRWNEPGTGQVTHAGAPLPYPARV